MADTKDLELKVDPNQTINQLLNQITVLSLENAQLKSALITMQEVGNDDAE